MDCSSIFQRLKSTLFSFDIKEGRLVSFKYYRPVQFLLSTWQIALIVFIISKSSFSPMQKWWKTSSANLSSSKVSHSRRWHTTETFKAVPESNIHRSYNERRSSKSSEDSSREAIYTHKTPTAHTRWETRKESLLVNLNWNTIKKEAVDRKKCNSLTALRATRHGKG